MANVLTIQGFDAFKNKLNKLTADITDKAGAIVFDEAKRWEGLAKRTAPKNFGRMAGAIQGAKTGLLSAEVVSPVKYTPYVEWGTGTRVSVPADLLDYALRFKGVKKVIGRHPSAFFFIHKSNIQASLNSRIQKYLNTPQ